MFQNGNLFLFLNSKKQDLAFSKNTYYHGSTWSLAIRFDRKEPAYNEMADNCEVCFLFEHAPHHLLSSNAEFIICEGPHKVGAIVIR